MEHLGHDIYRFGSYHINVQEVSAVGKYHLDAGDHCVDLVVSGVLVTAKFNAEARAKSDRQALINKMVGVDSPLSRDERRRR